LAPGPVTGSSTPWKGPTDAARRPSAHELSRRGRREAAPTTRGSRFPRCVASRRRQPKGVELAVLLDRFVGTERFLRHVELTVTLEREREQERLLRKAVESERAAHYRARLRRYAAVIAQAGECWKGGRIDLIRGQLAELEPQLGEDDPREFAWHYLSGRVPEQVILRSRQNDLDCIAVDPRGRLVASGGDGIVVVWDLASGSRVTELGRVEGHVAGICFSPDARRLAVEEIQKGSKLFRVWEIATGRTIAEHLEPAPRTEPPAFSDDGRILSYIRRPYHGASELIELDLVTRATRTTSQEAKFPMVHHRPDLGVVAVQSRVGRHSRVIIEQRVLHAGSRPRPDLTGLPGSVQGPDFYRAACLAYSRDGALVASAAVDGTIVVWDSPTGRERLRGKVPPESVRNVAFSPDGRKLAVAWGTGPASRVDWWDVESGKNGEPIRPAFAVRTVAFVSNRTLAIGLGDGTVRLWSLDPTPPSRELHHGAEVWGVAFSPDGSTLASGGDDHAVRLWNVADGAQQKTLSGHHALVMSVAYAPDGRTLVTGGFEGAVRLWDAAKGTSRELLPAHTQPVTAVAVSPNGRIIASRGRDRLVHLWDAATHKLLRELPCARSMTGSLAFSPDSAILVVASGDAGVQLWDVERATLTAEFPDPDYTWSVALSADGRTLAIGSANGEVRLYDRASMQLRGVLLGHEGGIRTMSFSPDGRTLATGSDDRTVRLWHIPTAQPLLVLRGHQEKVFAVQFSRDGRVLASGSQDGTVRLWQATDK
jgi:WD40 repeat protein